MNSPKNLISAAPIHHQKKHGGGVVLNKEKDLPSRELHHQNGGVGPDKVDKKPQLNQPPPNGGGDRTVGGSGGGEREGEKRKQPNNDSKVGATTRARVDIEKQPSNQRINNPKTTQKQPQNGSSTIKERQKKIMEALQMGRPVSNQTNKPTQPPPMKNPTKPPIALKPPPPTTQNQSSAKKQPIVELRRKKITDFWTKSTPCTPTQPVNQNQTTKDNHPLNQTTTEPNQPNPPHTPTTIRLTSPKLKPNDPVTKTSNISQNQTNHELKPPEQPEKTTPHKPNQNIGTKPKQKLELRPPNDSDNPKKQNMNLNLNLKPKPRAGKQTTKLGNNTKPSVDIKQFLARKKSERAKFLAKNGNNNLCTASLTVETSLILRDDLPSQSTTRTSNQTKYCALETESYRGIVKVILGIIL